MAEEEKEGKRGEEKKKRKDIMVRPREWMSSDWFPRDILDRSLTEMDKAFEEIDRAFDRMVGRPRRRYGITEFRTPVMDIKDEGDHYLLEAELPGIRKEDVDIEVTEDKLTVKGERKEEKKEEKEGYVRHERGYRSFYREIPMPSDVISDKATAEMKGGILKIMLPKTEKEKKGGKKIEVK